MDFPRVSSVVFTAPPSAQRKGGLLGWARIVLNEALVVDGIAIRRTGCSSDGRRFLVTFPSRRSRSGCRFYLVHPVNDDVRRAIEQQLLLALGLEESAP